MKITIPKDSINPHLMLTKAGYHGHFNGSYVMRLRGNDFPRFHVYIIQNKKGKIILNLHLDQSAAVYKNVKAHAGESSSEVVTDEVKRIKRWISYFKSK